VGEQVGDPNAGRDRPRLRVDVLGPLRVTLDGESVEVPGPRRRAVLALLATAEGRVVSTDEILDAVWPDEMPGSGRRALHSHISRLRGHLGPAGDHLQRIGMGYRLDLDPDALDVAEARRVAGDPALAGDPAAVGSALALWRGAALAEFAEVAPLAAEATAVAELRRALTDAWLSGRLAAGRERPGSPDPELVADATLAAADAPLRESTHALLVRILAAAGRQADALRAAHAFRLRLADETGLDPGPELTSAERQAARGALSPAAADGSAPPTPPPRARPASPMLGREHELAGLRRRIASERLITVVGPGGVGKTRLTLEAAADAADAGRTVVVVELAAVTDERRVPAVVAAALGLRSVGDEDVVAAARDALTTGEPVLVLDNCEHVLGAARALGGAMVDACPALTLVATSRRPLGLAAEHLVRLGPLPVPEEGAAAGTGVPAVEAFLAHARRREPDLAPTGPDAARVADIARRLDGLPLALELAAGRVGTLTIADLHARLDRALDLFEAGRPDADARHRTLRDTIDWSFRALPDGEALLLSAVAVFPGGVDLATAEWLGRRLGLPGDPAALVARLVDSSLLTARRVTTPDGDQGRYRPLETVRAFALDHLDTTGRRDAADAALVAWGTELTAELSQRGRRRDEAAMDDRLRRELPNLRAAWDLAGARGDLDARTSIVIDLDEVTTYRDLPDVTEWALDLAADPRMAGHPRRAAVLGAAASSAWRQGDIEGAMALADGALADATTPDEDRRARVVRGMTTLFRGDPLVAADWWEGVAQETDHDGAVIYAPAALAAQYGGDEARARALLDRAWVAIERHGAPSNRAMALYTAAEMAAGHDPDGAVELYGEAIALARSIGAAFVEGVASVGLVRLWGASGRTRPALEGYRTLLAAWRRSGHWTQVWTTMRNLATLLEAAGQAEAAVTLLAAADHAAEAAEVQVEDVAAELAAVEAALVATLGAERVRSLQARAARMPRGAVVDVALAAIDAALA
jgi:predicted ATPase/DNA-binding SARP family transcriptional activator